MRETLLTLTYIGAALWFVLFLGFALIAGSGLAAERGDANRFLQFLMILLIFDLPAAVVMIKCHRALRRYRINVPPPGGRGFEVLPSSRPTPSLPPRPRSTRGVNKPPS